MASQGRNFDTQNVDCNFCAIGSPILKFQQAMAFPKGTKDDMINMINRGIVELNSGLAQGLETPDLLTAEYEKYILKTQNGNGKSVQCSAFEQGQEDNGIPSLGFGKMSGILLFPIFVTVIAGMICISWYWASTHHKAQYYVSFVLNLTSGASNHKTLQDLNAMSTNVDLQTEISSLLDGVPECTHRGINLTVLDTDSNRVNTGLQVEVSICCGVPGIANETVAETIMSKISAVLSNNSFLNQLNTSVLAPYGLRARLHPFQRFEDDSPSFVRVQKKRMNNHPHPCYTFCYRRSFVDDEPNLEDVYDVLKNEEDLDPKRPVWQRPDVDAP